MNWWSRLPLPILILAFAVGGVIRIRETGGSDGYLLAGASLVMLGAWLALEVEAFHRKDDPPPPSKGKTGK